jgi:hypothetical protein
MGRWDLKNARIVSLENFKKFEPFITEYSHWGRVRWEWHPWGDMLFFL